MKFRLLVAMLICSASFSLIQAQPTPESEMPAGVTIHVVQRGENLFRIALQYGVTITELAELNGLLDANRVDIGQRLLVPTGEVVLETTRTHTVGPGESLLSIAQLYGTTVNALVAINEIPNANVIYPGQVLNIAPPPETSITNPTEVVPSPIPPSPTPLPTATPFTTETDAASADPLAGLTIIDPTATSEAPQPMPTSTAEPTATPEPTGIPAGSTRYHTVLPGETLFRIAQQYNLTLNQLASANSITNPERIFSGQQLIIPLFVEEQAVALDLPEILTSLNIRPLIFIEGETGSIVFETAEPVAANLTFLDTNQRVVSSADGLSHSAIVPIPMYTTTDTYPARLRLTRNTGFATEFEFSIRVVEGGYVTRNINISPQMAQLLAPVVQQTEIGLLSDLTRRFTAERYFEGPLSIPAAAPMNAGYGTRRSYNNGPVDTYHSGADFASAPGAPIYAAARGRVVLADMLNLRGNTIVIDHGWGIYTLYAHQTTLNVGVGEFVETGQIIGTAGSTGRVTGPHLHWEVWVNGVAVNPLQWTQQAFP